jgi:predicted CoA-binding protein
VASPTRARDNEGGGGEGRELEADALRHPRVPGAARAARRVVVLGASRRPESYSNRAVRRLLDHGFEVVPVHPRYEEVEGVPAVPSLARVDGPVDTLTVYVGPRNLEPLVEEIVELRPGRVVLNPGTESPLLEERLRAAGIPCMKDCTLVMLAGGEF